MGSESWKETSFFVQSRVFCTHEDFHRKNGWRVSVGVITPTLGSRVLHAQLVVRYIWVRCWISRHGMRRIIEKKIQSGGKSSRVQIFFIRGGGQLLRAGDFSHSSTHSTPMNGKAKPLSAEGSAEFTRRGTASRFVLQRRARWVGILRFAA